MDADRDSIHAENAAEYDRQAEEYNWRGPEVLFGLAYEYVHPGQRLLDVGTGTGLCALPFARAGLAVCGLDGARTMLDVCRAKGFMQELKQFDLRQRPWPYSDRDFDHVIAGGLFQFFGDLAPFFDEIARLIRPGGVFAFTVLPQAAPPAAGESQDDYLVQESPEGVPVYAHRDTYVTRLLRRHGFTVLKQVRFMMCGWDKEPDRTVLGAFAVRLARSAV